MISGIKYCFERSFLFWGDDLDKAMVTMASIIPIRSKGVNGSCQNIAPDNVGKIKPIEYTVEQSAVFPVVKADV